MATSRQRGRSRPMIEPLDRHGLREAGGVLARAFCNNPVLTGLFVGDALEVRLPLIEGAMFAFTRAMLTAGTAEVIRHDGRIAAVSLCYPPGAYPPGLSAELNMATGSLRAGPRRFLRCARYDSFLRAHHLKAPHWYLWILGVEPELQGRGFGSDLVRTLSTRADRDRVPCYLETDKPSSVQLYERHGYTVRQQLAVPRLGCPLWLMQRGG